MYAPMSVCIYVVCVCVCTCTPIPVMYDACYMMKTYKTMDVE